LALGGLTTSSSSAAAEGAGLGFILRASAAISSIPKAAEKAIHTRKYRQKMTIFFTAPPSTINIVYPVQNSNILKWVIFRLRFTKNVIYYNII
jgi:hypothetical protein